jgi:phosphatidylserine decarboxylase
MNTFLQHLVPQHALSRLAGLLSECRWPWLKNKLIHYVIKRYHVNLTEALIEDPTAYPTFNAFFTRALKPELRPIASKTTDLACPVDGSISQIGRIFKDTLLQAKRFSFNLTTLLGGEKNSALPFIDGYFATLYLAPKDYHRVHMPIDGTLLKTIYIPGRLFSVNQKTTSAIPQLFSRNERLVCLFETSLGRVAIILVGAMLVGSMSTVWEKDIRAKNIISRSFSDPIHLKKGEELGYFKMGSTVIVLFEKDKMTWDPTLQEGSLVRMGQPFGST